MEPDDKRRFGFYWVRFEGEITIGEYLLRLSRRYPRAPHWRFAGADGCFSDREVCELLAGPLAYSPRQVATPNDKLAAAKELGALGGTARAANLTPEKRRKIALKANRKRWKNYYESHPEKQALPKRRRTRAAMEKSQLPGVDREDRKGSTRRRDQA